MMFVMLSLVSLLTVLDKTNAKEVPPETAEWTRYSVALHILLPVAGFCILWGRRDLLTRLMLHLDRNCISVFCPSLSQREKLLKWASENLPGTWSSPSKTLSGGIPDLWKDGSLLCTLINMVVPGACPNPPKHWRKAPTHAQALAFKYLRVTPVFTESDFNGPLSPTQEKKFLLYLQEIQQAMKTYNEENENLNFTSVYLTKGMGLQTGEQYRKTIFYVYSNSTNSNCNNILVHIRGPYGTKGTATIPAFYNLNSVSLLDYSHKLRGNGQILFKKETRRSFLRSIALDITSFVNLERKVSSNDVPIHVEMETERAKITYIPNNYGIYEINLITNGEMVKGSPFTANIIESISGRKDSFDSTEKVLKELPAIRKKRIVSRYIDCINGKIELNSLEDRIVDNIGSTCSKNDLSNSEIRNAHSSTSCELKHDDKVNLCEKFEKLEQINEDQNENDTDCILNENNIQEERKNISSECSSLTASTHNIIPSVSISEPEEEIVNIDNIDNRLKSIDDEFYIDQNHQKDYVELEEVCNGSSMDDVERNDVEKNPLEAIVSIKPFVQYEEQTREQSSVEILENVIGDRGKIHDTLNDSLSKYSHITDTVEKKSFNLNTLNLIENPNRPTSIVTPFKQVITSGENGQCPEGFEKNESSVNINNAADEINPHIVEIDLENNETNKLNQIGNKSTFIETSINYFSSLAAEKKIIDEKNDNENLATNIGNNYVENLKAILMTKMNPEPENAKSVKDFINATSKLKRLKQFGEMQDENNNEFKHESPVTSSICSDHIAQEVESPIAQNYGKVSERRKCFTRQQCLSISSSNNSSISDRENEDVCEQLDGHKYNLRVLTVIDTIKKSTGRHILNRNTSMSVPNISKTNNFEDHNSSSYNLNATHEYRSTFLKTRDYWKKMLSENCLSNAEDSMNEKVKLNNSVRNISLSFSPDIYRSADDILSMSLNFKSNKLRRYSSLNQKDLEAIDFVSIEERKKKLLRDKYEQECIEKKYFLTRIPSTKSDKDESKIEATVKRLEKGSFKPSTESNSDCPNSNSSIPSADVKDEVAAKKESHVKRAIKFFKGLEESASGKRKPTEKKKSEIKRRFSLDMQKHQKDKLKSGGSLRTPKTLEKFSVTQIYFDIMSNRRGSFKGSPNRKALSETLASLSTNENGNQIQDSEENIKFNLFVNKLKTKKRKSIKSVFDINY